MVEGVLYTEVHKIWPSIEKTLAKAIDRFDGGYSSEDLLTACQLRNKQLWIIDNGKGAAITAITVLPQFKKLVIEYLAGRDMGVWLDEFAEEIGSFAEAHGCKYVESWGRKGWERVGKRLGADDVVTISRRRMY